MHTIFTIQFFSKIFINTEQLYSLFKFHTGVGGSNIENLKKNVIVKIVCQIKKFDQI